MATGKAPAKGRKRTPATTSQTTTNVTETTTVVEEAVATPSGVDVASEVADLKKENEELKGQLGELMALMKASLNQPKVEAAPIAASKRMPNLEYNIDDVDTSEPPSPSKQVKVISLCYGSLTLVKGDGRTKLKFQKYGEIKPVLYSDLMDYVNTNRNFADRGRFYILDKHAVYHLGLNDVYTKIKTAEILNNILDYPESEIRAIAESMIGTQKDTLVQLVKDMAYNDKNTDKNKVELVGKLCGCPNILSELQDMEKFSNLVAKKE